MNESPQRRLRLKRSLGLVLFSWWLIFSSSMGIMNLAAEPELLPPFLRFMHIWIFIVIFLATFFLLQLKEPARRIVLLANACLIVLSLLAIPATQRVVADQVRDRLQTFDVQAEFNSKAEFYRRRYPDGTADEQIVGELNQALGTASPLVITLIVLIRLALSVLAPGLVLYYFSRRDVKRRFA
ncbi:MAG: hypothetical protein JW937_05700 [Candidatus Omnitrophica bacterium]|nr:hypothetical protein [Candidatus Omnitrophota bacterium]